MPAPFEILVGGIWDIYLAPPATADPVVNVAPPGAWIKVGVSGKESYTEDGITIAKSAENSEIKALGTYATRKVVRVGEGLKVSFVLQDATLEAYRDAMNQTAVTTIAGPPAIKTIPLLENVSIPTTRAMLIRAALTPYMDGGNMQWWIPHVYQTGNPQTVLHKSNPVGLALEFTAIHADSSGFGKITAQTA
jgi:hypothetical protein